jgi:uncharacterized membrane protein
MQIVVTLAIIWILWVLLSWLFHAVKWLLILAVIASLVTIGMKYRGGSTRRR